MLSIKDRNPTLTSRSSLECARSLLRALSRSLSSSRLYLQSVFCTSINFPGALVIQFILDACCVSVLEFILVTRPRNFGDSFRSRWVESPGCRVSPVHLATQPPHTEVVGHLETYCVETHCVDIWRRTTCSLPEVASLERLLAPEWWARGTFQERGRG